MTAWSDDFTSPTLHERWQLLGGDYTPPGLTDAAVIGPQISDSCEISLTTGPIGDAVHMVVLDDGFSVAVQVQVTGNGYVSLWVGDYGGTAILTGTLSLRRQDGMWTLLEDGQPAMGDYGPISAPDEGGELYLALEALGSTITQVSYTTLAETVAPSLSWGGDIQSLWWDGPVEAVYAGDRLVWSGAVKITGTTGLESRDQLRAALAARGLSHATVTTIPFRLDTSAASDLTDLFIGCRALETVPEMDTSNVTSMAGMFRGCHSITSVPEMDTSNVVNMGFMFDDAPALETVPAFDMGAVREVLFMFRGCGSLRAAPLRELSVSLSLSDTVLDPAGADELISGLVEVTSGDRVLTLPSTADGANVAAAIRRGWSVAGVTLPVLSILQGATSGRVRVAFAGSSTTQGYGVPRFETYPHVMTARIVRAVPGADAAAMVSVTSGTPPASTGDGFHFLNVGMGGTTAGNYLNSARMGVLKSWGPDVVIHMIGSNDYWEQRSISTYKNDVRAAIRELPGASHVLTHSFRREDRADTGITWEQYGQALREVADEFPSAAFVDVSEAWSDRQEAGVDYLMGDRLHATWEGNELLAHCVADGMDLPLTAGYPVWAWEADDRFTRGALLPVTTDSLVQLDAVGPPDSPLVRHLDPGGVATASANNSGARYADTPPWGQAAAFPLAFFVVINSFGHGDNETSIAPFFSRSNESDDGWWWVWKVSGEHEYGAALNSALSPLATATAGTPRIVGVYMAANNRARVFVNTSRSVATLGPEMISEQLGPWMKSLRIGANASASLYNSVRIRDLRFVAAPVDAAGFMAHHMRELGAKYGVEIPPPDALAPFSMSSTEQRQIGRSTWTTVATHTVAGSGSGSVTLSWNWPGDSYMWVFHERRVRVHVNGDAVIARQWSGNTGAWINSRTEPVALNEGDVIRVDVHADASRASARVLRSWSLSIVPD